MSYNGLGGGGGVSLAQLQARGFVSVKDAPFNAVGDGVADDRAAILAAIEYVYDLGGGTVVGAAGDNYAYSGRIRIKNRVGLDLGVPGKGAKMSVLSGNTTGGIELEAGAYIRGELEAIISGYDGILLELNDEKTEEPFGPQPNRRARFDVNLLLARQTGSRGIVLHSNAATNSGVSWVEGRASVNEADYPITLEADAATGYVNENELTIVAFAGIEFLRMIAGSGAVDANRIKMTAQTDDQSRAGYAVRCQGQQNAIELTVWDWFGSSRLDLTNYPGNSVLFEEESGGNILTGIVPRGISTATPSIVDFAPAIRRNTVIASDLRALSVNALPMAPNMSVVPVMCGAQDDELAFAVDRYTVTTSGTTQPDSTNLRNMFDNTGSQCFIASMVDFSIKIDLGSALSFTEWGAFGLIFPAGPSPTVFRSPDEVLIETSVDDVTYSTQLDVGSDGENVPGHVYRHDGFGIGSAWRYIRITFTNDSAKEFRCHSIYGMRFGPGRTGGAFPTKRNAEIYNQLSMDGTKILGAQQSAIADSAGSDEQAKINAILAALRAHGLIAT